MLAPILFASAILVAAGVLFLAIRRRSPARETLYRQGRCCDCGHDVRANSGACPECGSDLFAQGLAYWRRQF